MGVVTDRDLRLATSALAAAPISPDRPVSEVMEAGLDLSPNGATAEASAARLTFHAPAAALPRMTSDSVEIRR